MIQDANISGADEYERLPPHEKQIILDNDMKLAINGYLSTLSTNPKNIHNLEDLVDFTRTCPQEEFPQRNAHVLERAEATDPEHPLNREMLAKDAYFMGEGGICGALS